MNIRSLFLDNLTAKQTIFKNTFWLMLAEGISRVLGFFLTILIARYLGAKGYGVFSFAFAFVALFGVLTDFGFNTLTIREVARDKKLARKYIDNALVIKSILGVITFAIIIIAIQFMGKTKEVKQLVYLVAIWTTIQSFAGFFQSIFRAFEKMQYEAISRTIYYLTLFCIVLFIIWQKLGIRSLLQSYIYAALAAFIIALILVRRKFTKFWPEIDFKFWGENLREAWPFALASIFYMIYSKINTVMLSIIRTDAEVGWYSSAHTLLYSLLFIPTILTGVFFPVMSNFYKTSKVTFVSTYRKIIRFISILGFVIFFPLFLFAEKIILLLYGPDYFNSVIVFKILIFALMMVFVSHIFAILLQAIDKQRTCAYLSGICVLVNITFNLLLIPRLGYIGAAITTVITEMIFLILVYFYTTKYLPKMKLF